MIKKPAVAVVVALLLAPAVLSAAGRPGPSPEQILRNPRLLARYLHLTPDQAVTEQQLFQTLNTTLKGLREQEKPLAEQLRALLAGSNPVACDVGALVVQIDGLRDQARIALETFDEAFSAILTPEQLARYEALKEAAHLAYGDDT